jgi:hypothetical protein
MPSILRTPTLSPAHIRAGKGIIKLGIVVAGLAGLVCVIGGIYAIYRNALSPSQVELFGSKVTTGHVGVAFVFIGLVVLWAVIRNANKTLVELGKIPN